MMINMKLEMTISLIKEPEITMMMMMMMNRVCLARCRSGGSYWGIGRICKSGQNSAIALVIVTTMMMTMVMVTTMMVKTMVLVVVYSQVRSKQCDSIGRLSGLPQYQTVRLNFADVVWSSLWSKWSSGLCFDLGHGLDWSCVFKVWFELASHRPTKWTVYRASEI